MPLFAAALPRPPRWHCEERQHNDLATLFLSNNHHTIVNLISMGAPPGKEFEINFRASSLAIYCLVYLVLMAIGAGLAIPGGLFMPSMIVSLHLGLGLGRPVHDVYDRKLQISCGCVHACDAVLQRL